MAEPLRSIESLFVCADYCTHCLGTGYVCEDHPERPWAGVVGDEDGCPCGAAGMPCRPELRQVDG